VPPRTVTRIGIRIRPTIRIENRLMRALREQVQGIAVRVWNLSQSPIDIRFRTKVKPLRRPARNPVYKRFGPVRMQFPDSGIYFGQRKSKASRTS